MSTKPISRLTSQLIDLLRINSETHHVSGVHQVQNWIQDELQDLGFLSWMVKGTDTKTGDFSISYRTGQLPGLIVMVCHADTCRPTSDLKFTEDKTFLIGPGAIDDKGGIVILVESLRLFNQTQQPSPSICVLTSPSEEMGSPGFQKLLESWGRQANVILGFEPALDDGSIIHSRRGNRWYEIQIQGHEAHSGRTTGEHVNAAEESAHKILKLSQLTDWNKELHISCGSVFSPSKGYNTVCGHIEIRLDTRFKSRTDRDQLHDKIIEIIRQKHVFSKDGHLSTESNFRIVDDCPPFEFFPTSKKWALEYCRNIQKIEGQTISSLHAGGASDVNYLCDGSSLNLLCVLDGLGAVGGKMHTAEEFVKLSSLETRSFAAANLMSLLAMELGSQYQHNERGSLYEYFNSNESLG